MDICTQDAKRGQYARLSIQVPLDQLVITSIYIGQFHQKILYKSINLLCHKCGLLGHSVSNCAYSSTIDATQNPLNSDRPQIQLSQTSNPIPTIPNNSKLDLPTAERLTQPATHDPPTTNHSSQP